MTLTLTLPSGEKIYTGRQVTFQAPCESEGLTGLIVDEVTYDLVSAMGTALVGNSFDAGAMVSVIFNVETQKAYVQNADTNAYLEEQLGKKYSPTNFPKETDVVKMFGGIPFHTGNKETYISFKTTATILTKWVPRESDVGYSQEISVSGILESDTPIIGPVQTGTFNTDKALCEAWNMITRITCRGDTILVYCDGEAPTVPIPIQITCIR